MKKFILVIIISVITSLGWLELSAESLLSERIFIIEEKILLKNLPKYSNDLSLWILIQLTIDGKK